MRSRAGLLALAGVAAAGAAAFAFLVEPRWVETTRVRLRWRGPRLRAVLLADLHAGDDDHARIAELVRRANALRPDVLLLGGDYVDGLDARPGQLDALRAIAALRARHGVFAVLGNHDSDAASPEAPPHELPIRALFARARIPLLDNEHVVLPNGVALVGMGSYRAHASDPAAAFASVPEGAPTLVLVHNPMSLELPGVRRWDVAVAGHTHGGQACLPFTGVCPFAEEDMRRYRAGLYAGDDAPAGGGALYVSRGLGESQVHARVGARPELVVLELQPA